MPNNIVLKVQIDGLTVREGRMALRDVAFLGQELQTAFESVARLTAGEKAPKRGALPEYIKVATNIELVGIEKGSFALTLNLPETQQSSLGEKALENLFSGLDALSKEGQRLPQAYDNRVLKAWHNLGKLFSYGIESIGFDLKTSRLSSKVIFDRKLYSIISELIARPKLGNESLEGHLLMIDISGLRCRIHLPSGDTIRCEFDQQLVEKVASALQHYVRVDGMVEREPTTGKVLFLHIQHIEILEKSTLSYPLEGEIDEELWLLAASHNPAFDYLNDAEEDIYSLDDGKPFHD